MKTINYELLTAILKEIGDNKKVTEKYLSEKYLYNERTIRRYIKLLKDEHKIALINNGKKREWKILHR